MTTYTPVKDPLPDGYRFATADETEFWSSNQGHLTPDERWVLVGSYSDGTDAWDLAVPIDFELQTPETTCPPVPVDFA